MATLWIRAARVTLAVVGLVAVSFAAAVSPGTPTVFAATFTVNSTADTFDGVCDSTNCTLREAISAANAAAGIDTISFNITAGPGTLKTIAIASELPDVTDPVIIDGATQPGFALAPVVRIRGGALIGSDGIVLNGGASGSTIRGLSITNFTLGDPLWLDGVTGVTIDGNYIGLYDPGTGAVAEVNGSGIVASGGGSHRITANVVNSYSTCISLLSTTGNVVRRNILGLSPTETPLAGCGPAGANPGHGIGLVDATDNIIGGPDGGGNTISLAHAFSVGPDTYGGVGIAVAGNLSARNRIRGNAVFGNDLLGIDLGSTTGIFELVMDGVTANDAMDVDMGANGHQNYPVLTTARVYGSSTVIAGTLHSTVNQQFAIDFYHAVSGCDPSAHGEGDEYGGSIVVSTDGAGDASFTATMPGSAYFTSWVATATDAMGNTSEFSECRFVLAPFFCVDDVDCDTVLDATDNCVDMYNPDQLNSDRNFIDHSPPYMSSVDDKTRASSDALGDFCDSDDDNDGIVDGAEFDGCNEGVLSAISADSDGDRFLDGAECALGTDPTLSASKPAVTACGATTDVDGDKLTERIEICFYGTDPANSDTDGDKALDGAKDGCEAASLNGDRIVNVADMGMLATAISNPTFRVVSVDVNKDGVWNPADQGLIASFISPSGQCPG